jgi:hypothetical protein
MWRRRKETYSSTKNRKKRENSKFPNVIKDRFMNLLRKFMRLN